MYNSMEVLSSSSSGSGNTIKLKIGEKFYSACAVNWNHYYEHIFSIIT